MLKPIVSNNKINPGIEDISVSQIGYLDGNLPVYRCLITAKPRFLTYEAGATELLLVSDDIADGDRAFSEAASIDFSPFRVDGMDLMLHRYHEGNQISVVILPVKVQPTDKN